MTKRAKVGQGVGRGRAGGERGCWAGKVVVDGQRGRPRARKGFGRSRARIRGGLNPESGGAEVEGGFNIITSKRGRMARGRRGKGGDGGQTKVYERRP